MVDYNPQAVYRDAPARSNGKSVTGPQAEVSIIDGQMQHYSPSGRSGARSLDYTKYREMRRDPTIALARDIAAAPALLSAWNVVPRDEDVDPKVVEYLQRYVLPLRQAYVKAAVYGMIDYGWRAFEVVYDRVEDSTLGTIVIPSHVKALRNDDTWVRYDEHGRFNGLIHRDPNGRDEFGIKRSHSIFVNFDTGCTGEYGDPMMLRAEGAYDAWRATEAAAEKYDEKLAGAVWVIHYPQGKTKYRGVVYDNSELPRLMYRDMQAGGYMSIPNMLNASLPEKEFGEFGQGGWKFELIEAKSSAVADFGRRLMYLDRLKTRALGVLERAVMEGEYGTKADASEHADVMLMLSAVTHASTTEAINQTLVAQVLLANFGESDLAKVQPQHVDESSTEFLKELYLKAIDSMSVGPEVGTLIDVPAVMEALGVPQDAEMAGSNGELSVFGRSNTDDEDLEEADEVMANEV